MTSLAEAARAYLDCTEDPDCNADVEREAKDALRTALDERDRLAKALENLSPPSIAGGAAPLSEDVWTEEDLAAADKKATELHRYFHPEKYAMGEDGARRLDQIDDDINEECTGEYTTADLIFVRGLLDSAHARIAELERERDQIYEAARNHETQCKEVERERDAAQSLYAALVHEHERNCEERDALQAKLDERDGEIDRLRSVKLHSDREMQQ